MFTGERPVWALDVDGVLNCFPAPRFDQLMASQDWRDEEVCGFKIWYRQSVVDYINEVHSEGLADILWLTTWGQKAVDELAPALDLPRFPTAVDQTGQDWAGPRWWKWAQVKHWVPADARLVWTDDQLSGPVRGFATARHRDSLLIKPDSNPGLTDTDVDLINTFLRRAGSR